MNIYFKLWIMTRFYVIYFVPQIVPALSLGNSSRLVLCLSDMGSSLYFFIQLPYFLSVWDTPGFVFPIPVLESMISFHLLLKIKKKKTITFNLKMDKFRDVSKHNLYS